MSVRSVVLSQFEAVAEEQEKSLPPLSDELVLLDSGLDSLCLAIIVARLEAELGVDPFTSDEDSDLPITLRDFITVYENAAK